MGGGADKSADAFSKFIYVVDGHAHASCHGVTTIAKEEVTAGVYGLADVDLFDGASGATGDACC